MRVASILARVLSLACVSVFLVTFVVADSASAANATPPALRLGLAFEENRGQTAAETRFLARGDGMLLELRERGASFHLRGGGDDAPREVRLEFVGTSARVRYDDLYTGIDALFYSKPARVLEYDLLVSPGIDPAVIGVSIEGADAVSIDDDGNLVIEAGGERLLQKRPYVY